MLLSEQERAVLQMSASEEITGREAKVELSCVDVKLAFTHRCIDKVI